MTLYEIKPHYCPEHLPRTRFKRQGKLAVCRECGALHVIEGYNSDWSSKQWRKVSERQEEFERLQAATRRLYDAANDLVTPHG